MFGQINSAQGSGFLDGSLGVNGLSAKRPYINDRGESVISVMTAQLDQTTGQPIYVERPIHTNASLRKDEWINLDEQLIEAARERLVIIDDLISGGLTYNAGGLGTLIAEWERASEITDGSITMDGESSGEKDRQDFSLQGVPIPVIHKEFSIGERMLMASRQRGAGLDVTNGTEAARAVARTSERMVFYGAQIGNVKSSVNSYGIPGLATFADRATFTISDWSDEVNVTPETIFKEILKMVQKMETEERKYGPFALYIPGAYASRFREDFKEFSDKTLMERVTDEDSITRVRVADALNVGDVMLIQMEKSVLDLAIASDLTTVQWASGSGWTNHFQNFAAWAPRLKSDYDGRCGILHASTP